MPRTKLLFTTLLVGAVAFAGCSGELNPEDPGQAYLLFRDALVEGDVDGMWDRTAPSTREYFDERYEQLVDMDEKIKNYLPRTDHKLARKQTGTILLDEIDSGRDLFEEIVAPEGVSMSEAQRLGSLIDQIEVSKNNEEARAVTRSGRTYRLVKGEDDEWYVRLVDSLQAVDESFEWLERNRSAVSETVNDLLEEEQEEREEIIADLMDVE